MANRNDLTILDLAPASLAPPALASVVNKGVATVLTHGQRISSRKVEGNSVEIENLSKTTSGPEKPASVDQENKTSS